MRDPVFVEALDQTCGIGRNTLRLIAKVQERRKARDVDRGINDREAKAKASHKTEVRAAQNEDINL